MILTRRHFLRSALAAPAIVTAANIMPVRLVDWEASAADIKRIEEHMAGVDARLRVMIGGEPYYLLLSGDAR